MIALDLDKLETEVREALTLRGCETISVPDQFHLTADYKGSPFLLESRAFRSERLAFARTVRVNAGASMQVFNCVLFPSDGRSIVSCEILAFQKGVHLFVLDAFGQSEHVDPAFSEMARAGRGLRKAYALDSPPEWGKNVFSPEVVIIKPPLGAALDTTLVEAFKSVLETSLDCQQESVLLDKGRRQSYLTEHAGGEPARPFLAKVAGEEWAERFISEFLFPLWLHDEEKLPIWMKSSLTGRLKSDTQRHHQSIEASALASALLEGSIRLPELHLLLSCYRIIWTALEEQFEGPENSLNSGWTSDMKKVPFLDGDLAHLKRLLSLRCEASSPALVSARSMASTLSEGDPGKLLGTLYVLEGSTLGGTILHKRICERSGITEPLRYYTPYQGREGSHWKAFCRRLDLVVVPAEDIVKGARWAFDRLHGMFEEISGVHSDALA